ncbi:MAG: type II toxin-antitoxin system HicB family antitoxin [Cyanobacteria bacterium J06621_12]
MNSRDSQIKSRFSFPVTLTNDEVDGGFTVTFRDLPEAITQGENLESALHEAADCLDEAIAVRIIRRDQIPLPSLAAQDEYLVAPPVQTSFKASIWLAMQEKNLSQSQFANLLGVNEKEVRRILDPIHNTKLPTLERSLLALGKRPVLHIA